MTTHEGEFWFRVTGLGSPEALEAHVDQVLEFLSEDDRILDPDYTVGLTHGVVMFSLGAEHSDQAEAFAVMNAALRAAIHAAEGRTSGWEAHFAALRSSVHTSELQGA